MKEINEHTKRRNKRYKNETNRSVEKNFFFITGWAYQWIGPCRPKDYKFEVKELKNNCEIIEIEYMCTETQKQMREGRAAKIPEEIMFLQFFNFYENYKSTNPKMLRSEPG